MKPSPGDGPAKRNECVPDSVKSRHRSPQKFFVLVFALSIPFWMIGGVTDLQLMPGLSVGVLMAFCPMAAALILVHREDRAAGMTNLLRRSFDFKRIESKGWFAPIVLLMPFLRRGF